MRAQRVRRRIVWLLAAAAFGAAAILGASAAAADETDVLKVPSAPADTTTDSSEWD
jgi:hypothetical protein